MPGANNDQASVMPAVMEKSAIEVLKIKDLLFESVILTDYEIQQKLLEQLPEWAQKPTLIFRGSQNNFRSHAFHQVCDANGPTLTVVKSNYHKVFCGFTEISWSSSDDSKQGSNLTILLSLLDNSFEPASKCISIDTKGYMLSDTFQSSWIKLKSQNGKPEVGHFLNKLACFGSEIIIKDKCH